MEQDFSLIAQARRHDAMTRRARRRAKVDMVLIALVTGGAAMAGADAHQSLMAGSMALSQGVLFYVIRRDRDLTALAGQGRWRDAALEGRGLKLEDWQRGAKLASWDARKGPQD